MSPDVLQNLARRWRWRIVARGLLVAFGAVASGVAVTLPWTRSAPWGTLLAVCGGAAFGQIARTKPWRIGPERVAEHLNRAHPELEESARLWLRPPAGLTTPETFQRQRLDLAWAGLRARGARPDGAPPGFWRWPLGAFAIGVAALALGLLWRTRHPRPAVGRDLATLPATAPAVVPLPPAVPRRPRLAEVELTVAPPAYTGRPPRTVPGLDAEVEEGATVTWRLRLDGPAAREVWLGFGAEEERPLQPSASGEGWEVSRVVGASSGLTHFTVLPAEGPAGRLPEVGALKVIPDAPPVVAVLDPAGPRTVLDPGATAGVRVEARVTDDYGVTGTRLVATVAKGSGEGVKFRERVLEFDPPPAGEDVANPRERRFTATLDFAALGMEPGDELYFHVEAEDNHPPTPGRARSETRFIALRGPASAPVQAGRGLAGINLVPEYFRSQRQLILDTERLLSDRPGLPEREFRRRAEDLGADQALLRLRYGQFVGEESSPGIGGAGDHAEVSLNPLRPGVPAGVPSDLVHRHDPAADGPAVNDPRAGLRTALRLRLEHDDQARGRSGDGHGHDAPAAPDAGLPPTAAQIVAPFVDQHDSQDAATLHDPGTKTALRGVLAEMWTAEGLLRTARPEAALAPERRALEMLKELQQGERLYVQRVGFEPAPLRVAERRGRGDVADVPARAVAAGTAAPAADAALAGVRAALAVLPGGDGERLTPVARAVLGGAAGPLGEAATRSGNGFLAGLRALRRLEAGDAAPEPGDLGALRLALLRLLPTAEERPDRAVQPAPSLLPQPAETPERTGGPHAP